MQKWVVRSVGFAAAVALFCLVAFLFFAILSDITGKQMIPRGAGWIVAPVTAGLFGARFAEKSFPNWAQWLKSPHGTLRYYVAGAGLWVVAVWCYVFMFDPFGGYWSSAEWAFVWKLMLTPIAFAALCGLVVNWLRPKAH
jgi:hypothetical protein